MFFCSLVPKYRYNSGRSFKYGGWSEFGYPPYSSCSVTFTSLSQCNRFSASYKTNPRYCDPVRDTVNLQCLTQPTCTLQCSIWLHEKRRDMHLHVWVLSIIKRSCFVNFMKGMWWFILFFSTDNDSCSTNYAVRLVNGTTEDEGRIEVCYRNKWTTFCGLNYVNPKVGSTICNQLGYGGNSCKCCYKYIDTSKNNVKLPNGWKWL